MTEAGFLGLVAIPARLGHGRHGRQRDDDLRELAVGPTEAVFSTPF